VAPSIEAGIYASKVYAGSYSYFSRSDLGVRAGYWRPVPLRIHWRMVDGATEKPDQPDNDGDSARHSGPQYRCIARIV